MEIVGEHGWHAGELAMHRAMAAPTRENPNWSTLAPNASFCLQTSGLMAVGAVDRNGRPWTSVWGGEQGFAMPVRMQQAGKDMGGVAARCLVDARWDPVARILREGVADGEGADAAKGPLGRGVKMAGLPIDLMNRNRAKLAGEVIGAVMEEREDGVADLQVVLKVDSSLGNCPKYLNQIPLRATVPAPALVAESSAAHTALPPEAVALIDAAPLFFLTTSHDGASISTNHRGGAPGFMRVLDASSKSSPFDATPHPVLAYPEYSGNRLYQSLGNLHETPKMGIAIPDFRSGAILFATCAGRMLMGAEAAHLMPRSNLVVALELREWRLVRNALGAVATPEVAASDAAWADAVGWSPYNPPLRPLAAELGAGHAAATPNAGSIGTATLVGRTELAPGIARFAFDLELAKRQKEPAWRPGQYVVLDFAAELDQGYRHMDDTDPSGLNDDLLRTFTVSSPPFHGNARFELTLRDVGRATHFLARANVRGGIEIAVRAFGGDFVIPPGSNTIGFVAGGIGVTPLLAQMQSFNNDGRNVSVWWAASANEVSFVHAAVSGWFKAAAAKGAGKADVALFLSGDLSDEGETKAKELESLGVLVQRRRIEKGDFESEGGRGVGTFYICAGKSISAAVQKWLADLGKTVVEESFAF